MLNRGHVPMLAENTKVKILDNMYLFRPENAFRRQHIVSSIPISI